MEKVRVRFELGEKERGLGDSLGLLQRQRRWTACDDWRLSVEKNRGEESKRRECMGDMKYVGSEMKACGWRNKCGIIIHKSAFASIEGREIKTK